MGYNQDHSVALRMTSTGAEQFLSAEHSQVPLNSSQEILSTLKAHCASGRQTAPRIPQVHRGTPIAPPFRKLAGLGRRWGYYPTFFLSILGWLVHLGVMSLHSLYSQVQFWPTPKLAVKRGKLLEAFFSHTLVQGPLRIWPQLSSI